MTSTIYARVASSQVSNACFIHCRRYLWWNLSGIIPEPTTSWCLMSRTMQQNALVDNGGFPLRAALNCSLSSLCILTVPSVVSWWPVTPIWSISQPIASCFLSLLLPVVWTMFKCASQGIFSVAVLAASWWTDWCLGYCCMPASDALDEVSVDLLDSDPLSPAWGVCVAMMCWSGIGEEDDNEKKWEVPRHL